MVTIPVMRQAEVAAEGGGEDGVGGLAVEGRATSEHLCKQQKREHTRTVARIHARTHACTHARTQETKFNHM